MNPDRIDALTAVCRALSEGAPEAAAAALTFQPEPIVPRRYGPLESTAVFVRDGFIDRYSGNRLVFPPVLRVISMMLPDEFPFHPNWKTDVTHRASWEVGATIDHLVPVTRGGAGNESNWLTTSMARNSAKMNWTIDELGWPLHPAGNFNQWDGLLRWFVEYSAAHPSVTANPSIRQWHRATATVLASRGAARRCDGG